MKYVVPCLLIGIVLAAALAAQGQVEPALVDVIIVAGQSNAVGYDAKPSELPADPNDKEILYWWRCGDPPPDDHDTTSQGKWTHLRSVPPGNPSKDKKKPRQYGNFAQAEGGFGPEMGLARTLRAKQTKRLAVIKVAFSGTSLFGDWDPRDSGEKGACYRALVKETKAALVAATKQGLNLRFRAFAWIQGESDANAVRAPGYAKALSEMIVALRKDLEATQMVTLLAVNTRFGGDKNTFMPKIVQAQKEVAERDRRCVYVDTATAAIANSAHFSAAGTLDVGQRMAEALLKLEGQSSASTSNEPRNAREAAAKRATEDAAINDKFAAWKATLTREQQAWEGVLEANLGGFYLPIYKRDKVANRVTAWDYVKDDPKLPRVLLIGDSISRGYTIPVRKALEGKANVHRAPENCGPTANGLKKLDVWMGPGKWDIIHFNFGIHDRATPIAEYEHRLDEIVLRLKKTGAIVIWASTTPVPPDTKDGEKLPAAIAERNDIAVKVMVNRGVVLNDLFTFLTPHLAKVANAKDVHFNAEGYEILGRRVAEVIETQLNAARRTGSS